MPLNETPLVIAEEPQPEKKVTRARPPSFVKSAYLKRDYGYNILIVCDSTTRIRFADVIRPAGWSSQQVFTSGQLFSESDIHFEGNEYLVADDTFTPDANVIPMFPESELEDDEEVSNLSSTATAAATDATNNAQSTYMDRENKKKINEALGAIHRRAKDCQRTLKARFPSLLGMRVQLKSDQGSQENARNWILACMTVHNLVLGDDASYNRTWEDQLEEMEAQVIKQQEQQARLMWKLEHHPPKKLRKEQAPAQDAEATIPINNEDNSTVPEERGIAEGRDGVDDGKYELDELDDDRDAMDGEDNGDGQEGTRVSNEDQEMYQLEDTPTPEDVNSNSNATESTGDRKAGNSANPGSSSTRTDVAMDPREGLNAGRLQSGHSLSMLLN
ncbi:hypothetical protein BGX27_003669 [Mortierella sp. AM989]|nr:hypothetical protein BGX27_003669 [Mortierella sp. AM989]